MSEEAWMQPEVTLSRGSDPWTSHYAALNALRAPLGKKVLECHRYHPLGLTDYELGVLVGWQKGQDNNHRKRRSELYHAGYLEDSSLTRQTPTGCWAVVWRLTVLGATGGWPLTKKPRTLIQANLFSEL